MMVFRKEMYLCMKPYDSLSNDSINETCGHRLPHFVDQIFCFSKFFRTNETSHVFVQWHYLLNCSYLMSLSLVFVYQKNF